MNDNGVTRREFDRLDAKVSRIDEGGSRKVGILEERMRETREDVKRIERKLDENTRTTKNNTRTLWGLGTVFLVGCISIIVTLLTHASA